MSLGKAKLAIVWVALVVGFSACDRQSEMDGQSGEVNAVPGWVADAVFYQIFPERFRNGDPSNDPVRESLEFPIVPSDKWEITPWTENWYARADWEKELGPDFYENGVFHRRFGGDLQGVIDKLGYLKDLGINTVYFNPVFYARSMHKYDGNSFHHIDPYFGPDPEGDFALMAQESSDPASWNWTAADKLFLELVEQAHQMDIRIVIDGVFNHTGRNFFAFEHLVENQTESPYADWYIVKEFDDPGTPENEFDYEGWWGVETLPLFADTEDGTDLHPGPKEYVFDITKRWMDPDGDGNPSDGVDGWRLDVAPDVPIKFWSDWNALVRQLNPDAYTVGEYWDDAIASLEAGGFSATMNYHGFAQPVKAFLIDEQIGADEFVRLLEDRRHEYSDDMSRALQNLMDSHDTDRLASMIVNPRRVYSDPAVFDYDRAVTPRGGGKYDVRAPNAAERRKQQLVGLFQFTYVGAPMLYYGTESGMWGADDPDDRQAMVWDDMTYEPQTINPDGSPKRRDEVKFDAGIFDYYQNVIALRKENPAFIYGDFAPIVDENTPRAFAFTRSYESEKFMVGINDGDDPVVFTVSGGESAGNVVFTVGDDAEWAKRGEQWELSIPPHSGTVIEL